MDYYIKVGNMYVVRLSTDRGAIKNEFISNLDFNLYKDFAIKICEEEKSYYVEKICNILKIDKDKCNITFEEVEEDE